MVCNTCKQSKDEDAFYPYKSTRCKDCLREYDRKRYPQRKQYLREKYVDWYRDNKEHHYRQSYSYTIAWQKRNPEKKRAHNYLYESLKRGDLERPVTCSVCLQEARVEGHHEDYTKPLDVWWLCRGCHKQYHAKRNPGNLKTSTE